MKLYTTAIVLLNLFVVAFGEDSYVIDDSVGLGRRFDGIGAISGGGATSKLLRNYSEPWRSHILDYLFKPNFGASLHILKVEIGGDSQSTEGTEASHMHNAWDENYERGYEWWLMVEAKKRNPDIKLFGLPWGFPGWLSDPGKRDPYEYPERTAQYIIKWIQGAKKYYNLTIDYIGEWNEKHYNTTYLKVLRKSLDGAGLQHVRIVAPDGPRITDWQICPDLMKDPELAKAVDIVGYHYPGTLTTKLAVVTEKPLWASEDYSTFNDITGGGCWARLLNQNYVNGNITGTIAWNAIASYYQDLPFGRDALMTAESPWSGHYVLETPIWMTAHHTQFSKIGWYYLKHGYGAGHLNLGGSYVTLESPDGKDFTIVIETMSHDHSVCIRPPLPPYSVEEQDAVFQLKGHLANIKKLYVWHSKLNFEGGASILFKAMQPIEVTNATVRLHLVVDEVYTLTTLATGNRGARPPPPPPSDFPLPYFEDFEAYDEHAEPHNFAQQTGAFEVIQTATDNGKVMRQMVLQQTVNWCGAEYIGLAANVIGNFDWEDIYAEVEAKLGDVNGTDGVFLAARVDRGGCVLPDAKGIFWFIYPENKTYIVSSDIVRETVLKAGSLGSTVKADWNRMALLVKGKVASGVLNNQQLFTIDTSTQNITTPTHGFVALGTTSYGIADFDRFAIRNPSQGEQLLKILEPRSDTKLYFKPGPL